MQGSELLLLDDQESAWIDVTMIAVKVKSVYFLVGFEALRNEFRSIFREVVWGQIHMQQRFIFRQACGNCLGALVFFIFTQVIQRVIQQLQVFVFCQIRKNPYPWFSSDKVFPQIQFLQMSIRVNQVAQKMCTVIRNPITSQVQYSQMLTDWYALDQWVNDFLLFNLVVLQVKSLKPTLWMTDQLHHLVV